MRRRLCVGALLGVLAVVSSGSAVAQEVEPAPLDSLHRPPVHGLVVDPFRPPLRPWLAGNRGIEYATMPGSIATASADGVVIFAGSVAGRHHVTVRHSPELVTTVAFVAEILVAEGQRVARGEPIAVVGVSVHFTARLNGSYIDPEILFAAWKWVLRLVPPIE